MSVLQKVEFRHRASVHVGQNRSMAENIAPSWERVPVLDRGPTKPDVYPCTGSPIV